jgi:hypothetical protein
MTAKQEQSQLAIVSRPMETDRLLEIGGLFPLL